MGQPAQRSPARRRSFRRSGTAAGLARRQGPHHSHSSFCRPAGSSGRRSGRPRASIITPSALPLIAATSDATSSPGAFRPIRTLPAGRSVSCALRLGASASRPIWPCATVMRCTAPPTACSSASTAGSPRRPLPSATTHVASGVLRAAGRAQTVSAPRVGVVERQRTARGHHPQRVEVQLDRQHAFVGAGLERVQNCQRGQARLWRIGQHTAAGNHIIIVGRVLGV